MKSCTCTFYKYGVRTDKYCNNRTFSWKEKNIYILTDKVYGLREVHREVLAPVVSDGDLEIADAAALLKRVRQVWCHVQHVL